MSHAQVVSDIPRDVFENLPAAYTFVDIQVRGEIAEQKPRVVFIEITNHCNLFCETCPRTFVSYEEPKTVSFDDFVRIVEQFPDLSRAVLHGIGEPLINQDLPRMIEYLKARGAVVLFNSNATLLNERWTRALISSGLDEIRCSVDGVDPRTYARIRGLPLVHKIVRNLKRLTEIQRELSVTKPKPSIWMTAMRENIGELPDLVRLAAQVGVHEVYVQRMVYYLDNPEPPGWMAGDHALYGDLDEQADRIISKAEVVARELGITLKSSGATDPRRSLGGARGPKARPWAACLRPWSTAYITANGNCLPCCISPFATQDYESLKMGNLFEQRFDSIWNSERYRAWRNGLLSDRPHTACKGCGVHWSL